MLVKGQETASQITSLKQLQESLKQKLGNIEFIMNR